MRKKRALLRVSALAATAMWIFFIFNRSARTAEESMEETVWVMNQLGALEPGFSVALIRKLAHFSEYFILGALLWLDWRLWGRGSVLRPLGVGLVFAGGDEFFQTFVPGRSGQLTDVLIDGSGLAMALLLLCLLWKWRQSALARQNVTKNSQING